MDLLGSKPKLDLRDIGWKINSRNNADPPHFVGSEAVISNSLVTEGCEIHGRIENSVLSSGVYIKKGAVVRDSVIFGNVVIGEGSVIDYSIIDSDTQVGVNCRIGGPRQDGNVITLVGGSLSVPDNCVIEAGSNADAEVIAKSMKTSNQQ